MSDIVKKISKNLLLYDLCGIGINDDGTTTCFHSDRYMDEHPECKSRECTFNEFFNEETVKYMLNLIHKTNGN